MVFKKTVSFRLNIERKYIFEQIGLVFPLQFEKGSTGDPILFFINFQ